MTPPWPAPTLQTLLLTIQYDKIMLNIVSGFNTPEVIIPIYALVVILLVLIALLISHYIKS